MPKTIEQRVAETTCTRCGQARWPFKDWAEPYTCQRCTAILAGKRNVVDPLPTPAQVARGKALNALRAGRIATEPNAERESDLTPASAPSPADSGEEQP